MYLINAFLIALSSLSFVTSLDYHFNYHVIPNPTLLNYSNKFAKYLVSIHKKEPQESYFGENHFCGGVIIAPTHVLTTSHCVFDSRFYRHLHHPNELLIIAGTPNRLWPTANTRILNVAEIIPYSYGGVYQKHDLAVLRLSDSIDLNQTQTLGIAPLDDMFPLPLEHCSVYGWGTYFLNGPYAENLLELDFIIQTEQNCKSFYPGFFVRSMLCGLPLPEAPKDACNGDSGGALFCDNKLTGIVSLGVFCNRKYPTIFASIFYHRDWIQRAIGSGSGSGSDGFCHHNHWRQHLMFCLLNFMIAIVLQKI